MEIESKMVSQWSQSLNEYNIESNTWKMCAICVYSMWPDELIGIINK